jgi:AraC family transcriptional regulator
MQKLCVPSGQYAVFEHHGPMSGIQSTFDYIFDQWLPASGYTIDQRPHIAEMDERYRPDQSDSVEHLYIPVRRLD